ncbi:MAG: hypothetical protein LLG09_04515 [Negativicutes bacterium]|nr:hypothetical protein [Negativicutes bacterium]
MIEQVFQMSGSRAHVIEAVIRDENLHYMHMVLLRGEALPTHVTNAVVYMAVIAGTLSLRLADGALNVYERGTVLKIPRGIVMEAGNQQSDPLELTVVKAPPPQS